jgi:hypothetical protein
VRAAPLGFVSFAHFRAVHEVGYFAFVLVGDSDNAAGHQFSDSRRVLPHFSRILSRRRILCSLREHCCNSPVYSETR